MATEKTRGAPKKQQKKPKAPSTAKAARREAAKKAHQSQRRAPDHRAGDRRVASGAQHRHRLLPGRQPRRRGQPLLHAPQEHG